MERTWYVVAIAKISVIFRGVFYNPKEKIATYMSDKELDNLREFVEIVEYRDNKDFPKGQPQSTTKSGPIIQENSKGEENGTKQVRGDNKDKHKAKISKS